MNAAQRAEQCRALLDAGHSQRFVARVLHMGRDQVRAIQNGQECPGAGKRRGRPAKISPEVRIFVEANLRADATICDEKMASLVQERFGISIHRTSICRMRRDLQYFYRPPKVIQNLTEEQRDARIEFCRWVLQNQAKIPNLIFSDESRFEIGPDNTRRRIKRGVLNPTCFAPRNKYSKGVMVWGAIGPRYKSILVRCSKGEDSSEYLEILGKSRMLSDLDTRFGRSGWTFVQDGAPCHQSREALSWLADHHVVVAPGWPPNSPDLNPIEMIWGVMKRTLRQLEPNEHDLFSQVEAIWDAIALDSIDKLVSSFIGRCQQVLDVRGESITPYLSGHRVPPRREDDLPPSQWTDRDDAQLMRLYETHGAKWTLIGRIMGRRPMAVKNRYRRNAQIAINEHLVLLAPLPAIDTIETDLPDVEELDDFLAQFK